MFCVATIWRLRTVPPEVLAKKYAIPDPDGALQYMEAALVEPLIPRKDTKMGLLAVADTVTEVISVGDVVAFV